MSSHSSSGGPEAGAGSVPAAAPHREAEVGEGRPGGSWEVSGSGESHRCINPIRLCEELHFTDVLKAAKEKHPDLELIKLSIGCPAVFGNLPPHSAVREAVRVVLEGGLYEGYAHSCGLELARTAIAKRFSCAEAPLTCQDVVMTCGCSGAIELSLAVLSNPGQNVLCPQPGFPLFPCHLLARGVEPRFYALLPERSWEVDLEDMERKIDDQTAAIVVNNPSNPCGSVYSRKHLEDILAIAERHKLPILSDETYAGMVFSGQEFHSVASISRNVPVLTCGTLAKRFLVPGWRLGWILVHDRHEAFKREITPGLRRLAMKILGPCTLIQAALPDIFKNVPASFFQTNMEFFENNAKKCFEELSTAPGLRPVMPSGTMYMMVMIELAHFPEFKDDVAFTRQLVLEQSVFCLPGMAFNFSSCFRVVLMMPIVKIAHGCGRIRQFCKDHYRA